MTTYLITRHLATVDFLKTEFGYKNVTVITHADEKFFTALSLGDNVIGILPAPLMAKVCDKTQKPFSHFDISIPPELRGKELSVDDLKKLSPKITKFWIRIW